MPPRGKPLRRSIASTQRARAHPWTCTLGTQFHAGSRRPSAGRTPFTDTFQSPPPSALSTIGRGSETANRVGGAAAKGRTMFGGGPLNDGQAYFGRTYFGQTYFGQTYFGKREAPRSRGMMRGLETPAAKGDRHGHP